MKELYRKNAYGIMGTLIFHILLVTGFWVAELDLNVKIEQEEAILLDFTAPEEKLPEAVQKKDQDKNTESDQSNRNEQNTGSNRAVNDAMKKDKFFDDSYNRDIEEAKKMVVDVNKQLSKKILPIKKFEMPEATTEGQDPDSIKNVIYSGKSNIHYSLENRFHIRLPIPVYLAKSGGLITVDIQVDRNGKVIKAEARPAKNINDPMLPIYATQAAERTVFNPEPTAPAVQKGTITYKFVAQ
ncbi:MAG TPA: hypothetical protein VFC65_18370 [Prolixibacteraceae bacterium]|nr:hypothetical protein [Prolixibacteraceae bacterium]